MTRPVRPPCPPAPSGPDGIRAALTAVALVVLVTLVLSAVVARAQAPGEGTGDGTGEGTGQRSSAAAPDGAPPTAESESARLVGVALDRAEKAVEPPPVPELTIEAAEEAAEELIEPIVDPQLDPMRQVGRAVTATRERGATLARGVAQTAQRLCRPRPDRSWDAFTGDTITTEAATLLNLTEAELAAAEPVATRLEALRAERTELALDLEASRQVADLRGRRARRFLSLLDSDEVVSWESRRLIAPVVVLLQRLAAQAAEDVRALERRSLFLSAAVGYLERRTEAIALAASQAPQHDIDLTEIREEIDAAQARLDREAEETLHIEAEAEVARRRAEEEVRRAQEARDGRLQAIAEEWGTIAPLLDQIRDLRRIEESRLAGVNQQRATFLREQADIREQIGRIIAAPEADQTVQARSDRLYNEIFANRRDTREQVLLARREIDERRERILRLEGQVGQRRGDLELLLGDRQAQSDDRLFRSLVGLREAQVDLAQKRVDLENLRLQTQESLWELSRRQVYFYALMTDALVDHLSDQRRELVFDVTGANLLEAQQNIRDRWIGLSLLAKDRANRLDELTSWLGSFEGLSWLAEVIVLLVLVFVGYRLLLKYRDRWLSRLIDRLSAYAFVERHLRGFLQFVEMAREAVGPLAAWLATRFFFGRFRLDLPELELFREALVKVIVLWLLIKWSRCLILPVVLRRERGHDVAPYAVDALDVPARQASLILITIRVWLIYLVVAAIAVDVVEFILGRGFAPNLFATLLTWAQAALVYGLLWLWRDEIVDRFLKATKLTESRTGRLLKRHKDRIYSVLFLLVLAAYNIGRWVYNFTRNKVITLQWWRQLETFFFRRRIELAGSTAEHEMLETRTHAVPPIYLRYLLPDADVKALNVHRTTSLAQLHEAFARWVEDPSTGGTVAIPGEFGVGKSTLLDQFEAQLLDHHQVTRHQIDNRLTHPKAVLNMLCWLFELPRSKDQQNEPPSEEELVQKINEGSRRVVLVDDCHMLFLRTIKGFAAVDSFLSIVSLTASKVFWGLTFDRYAWEYLNRVNDRRHHFRAIVDLAGMTDVQVREMIERRNDAGNLKPDFSTLIVTGRGTGTSPSGPANYEVVKTAAGYYRLLTEYAQGNPSVALHFWRESLRAKRGGGIEVVLFKRPLEDTLKALSERQLFALTAIAQHEDLTPEEISRVVDVDTGLCKLDVNFLTQAALITVDERGRATLATPYLRPILARLRAANLLYFKIA